MRRSRVASVNDAELGSLSPLLSTPVLGSPRPRSGTRSKAKERRSGTAGRRLTGRRIVYACALVLLVGLALLWSLQAVLVLAFFKLRNHATDERWWTRHGCRLRKRPLVFILDQTSAAVVWETTCDMPALALDWALAGGGEDGARRWATATVEQIGMPGDRTETHFVQRSTISGLDGVGQLHLRVRDNDTVLATTGVPWTWTSASATIAAVSDNQYNVRVFQHIVRAIRAFIPAPSLLLHAGDAVQTASSLQQWQTDFWDPVALLGRRTPPILCSIGNHDHDTTRAYAYTIGRGPTWRAITIGASRWVVLNSQIDEGPGDAQELFLRAELESAAWRDAAIRVIVVHVAPFVEYWEPASWTTGQERLWCVFGERSRSDAAQEHSRPSSPCAHMARSRCLARHLRTSACLLGWLAPACARSDPDAAQLHG